MKMCLLAASAIVLSGCSYFDGSGDFMSPYANSSHGSSAYYDAGYSGCGQAMPQNNNYIQYTECGSHQGMSAPLRSSQYMPQPVEQFNQCGTQAPQYNHMQSSPCGGAPAYVYSEPAPVQHHAVQHHAMSECATPCGAGYAFAQPAQAYYGAHNGSYNVPHGAAYHTNKPAFRHNDKRGYAYGELGVNGVTGIDDVDPIFGAIGRVGYQSPYYLGVEIEGFTGLTGDDVVVTLPGGDEDAEFKLERSMGAFGVVRVPVGEVTALLRGGYHESVVSLELDNIPGKVKEKDTGYAVGGGLEIPLSRNAALRADTTYYEVGDDESFWSTALTYQQKF